MEVLLGDETAATADSMILVPTIGIDVDAYDSPDLGEIPGVYPAMAPYNLDKLVERAKTGGMSGIESPRATVPPKFLRDLKYRRVGTAKGRDVYAVERALKMLGFRHREASFTYGWRAKRNVLHYQQHFDIPVKNGVYEQKTHWRLAPHFDGYSKWLYEHTDLPDPKPAQTPVDRLMRSVWWLYGKRPWVYHPYRPFRLYSYGVSIPYAYDCSWFATEVYYSAGLPDPNGVGYKGGYGNTESLRAHGTHVGVAQPGDLIFFGYYGSASNPAHVAVAVDNGKCIGFGSTGGPRLLYQNYRTIREIRRYV